MRNIHMVIEKESCESNFIGRQVELKKLNCFISQPESMIKLMMIESGGEGGIGKTKLLLKIKDICHEDHKKYLCADALISLTLEAKIK